MIKYSDPQASSSPLVTSLGTTVTTASQLSVAVNTSIAGILSQLTVLSPGKLSTNSGAWVSSIVNLAVLVLVLPQASVAVNITSTSPTKLHV
ncbi:hypothetical protein F7018_02825 [Tenacibaculum aiptasiae]|uniref:Uncharacterized protein n=1 Tax=Tenacibaculum aiptasiae TaxID=426481 RepID=A0A7J5ARD7_9FLAO|nr:hypothetical protein F7018_02825 [Tenacibaculum aiptasiae]